MKIVSPDIIDLSPHHRAQLQLLGEVSFYDDLPSKAEVIDRIQAAELIIPAVVPITRSVIESCPTLRYIVVPGIGVDFVHLEAATERGIRVINCPIYNTAAVAEYTLGLMFALLRRIPQAQQSLRHGTWDPNPYKGSELAGKTLGLIGRGNIGQKVAVLAKAVGMQVKIAHSQTSASELDQLIAGSDILSLHLPLTESSRGLIDARRIRLLKPSAFVINTARGAIIDQSALFTALQTGQIAGAALDVFESEPISGAVPDPIQKLANLDTVIATPHIAYNSAEAMLRLGEELIANVRSCLAGDPLNVVA